VGEDDRRAVRVAGELGVVAVSGDHPDPWSGGERGGARRPRVLNE
jgi:hypothetical protein